MPSDAPALYAPWFTEEERRDLQAVPHDDLTGEIYLLHYQVVVKTIKTPSCWKFVAPPPVEGLQ